MADNKPIIRFYFAKTKKAFMELYEAEKMAFMYSSSGLSFHHLLCHGN